MRRMSGAAGGWLPFAVAVLSCGRGPAPIPGAGAAPPSMDAGAPCGVASTCPYGLTCCDGACLSVNRDARGCGTLSCQATNLCPPGLSCCGDFCIDLARDGANCGQCGRACGGGEFCSGRDCLPLGFAKLCDVPQATVVNDGAGDRGAGGVLGAALASVCVPAPTVRALAPNTDAGSSLIDPRTGEPLAGIGDLLAVAGGPDVQPLVRYLERSASPIYYSAERWPTLAFVARGRGEVVEFDSSQITSVHDFAVLELVLEPSSGTLSLVCYGVGGEGTAAGAWYFANRVLPTAAAWPQSWALLEWSAAANGTAGFADDTFRIVAQGN
jgi:hypothetical protein